MAQKVLQTEWRFIDTGISDGFTNMAIDEAMFRAHEQEMTPPTLRVYEWNPATLTVGYFQNITKDIDEQKCLDNGIDIVRRATGGRSVLHKDEVTYSVVASGKCGFPYGVSGSYKAISQGLIAAYKILGLNVSLAPHREDSAAAACFNAASFGDLTCQGRKIAGSAQYRRGDVLLQHGSLPISLDVPLIFSVLKFPSSQSRERAVAVFRKRATGLTELLGRKVDRQEMREALFQGFQEALGIRFFADTLSSYEENVSQALIKEKYNSAVLLEAG
jgi:lipoyl(octanoyl) transferase